MSQAPLYDVVTPATSRGLSAALWQQSLQDYATNDPAYGTRLREDFVQDSVNATDASAVDGWFLQDAAAGGTVEVFSNVSNVDGVRRLSCASGTDHFGVEVHYGSSATTGGFVNLPSHASDARGRVVYETRVDLTGVDQFFIGLSESIVQFLSATSALPTASDYIGFYRNDAGGLTFSSANDNAGGTAVAQSLTVLSAANMPTSWVKLGFAVNVDLSVDIVVNGVWYNNVAKTANPLALPIETLTCKYAITRGVTGDLATLALPVDSVDVYIANAA